MNNSEVACKATGTDLCVYFTKPARGKPPRYYRFADNEKIADHQFVPAHFQIRLDEMSTKREINGIAKLAEWTNTR